ncbi:alpha/beta hydrolase [Colwelliaceae bacterium BS250]
MKYYLTLITAFILIINLMACASSETEQQSEPIASSDTQLDNDKVSKTETKSAKDIKPSEIIEYKNIDGISLSLHVFYPQDHKATDNTPAMVFFHGGGWNGGSPHHFYRQSQHLANKGMVAISAQYRVKKQHNTTPKESLKDGKSAMRWVRSHAQELGINPNMIAAGGGSAGGHVAAATGTATAFEEDTDDKSISYRPDALVLFNPVFDNGPGGYGHGSVKAYWQQFSPLHNVTKDTPPTIGMFGEKDTAIKVKSALKFETLMKEFGTTVEVHIYKDQPHGFFNEAKYDETVLAMDKFLTKQGFIQ